MVSDLLLTRSNLCLTPTPHTRAILLPATAEESSPPRQSQHGTMRRKRQRFNPHAFYESQLSNATGTSFPTPHEDSSTTRWTPRHSPVYNNNNNNRNDGGSHENSKDNHGDFHDDSNVKLDDKKKKMSVATPTTNEKLVTANDDDDDNNNNTRTTTTTSTRTPTTKQSPTATLVSSKLVDVLLEQPGGRVEEDYCSLRKIVSAAKKKQRRASARMFLQTLIQQQAHANDKERRQVAYSFRRAWIRLQGPSPVWSQGFGHKDYKKDNNTTFLLPAAPHVLQTLCMDISPQDVTKMQDEGLAQQLLDLFDGFFQTDMVLEWTLAPAAKISDKNENAKSAQLSSVAIVKVALPLL